MDTPTAVLPPATPRPPGPKLSLRPRKVTAKPPKTSVAGYRPDAALLRAALFGREEDQTRGQ